MALNRSLTRIGRQTAPELPPTVIPDRLTPHERFGSWLKDVLLARDEYPWTLFTFFSTISIAWVLLKVLGEAPLWSSPGIIRITALALLVCFVAKGLDIFRKEKRLDSWKCLSLLSAAWMIVFAPAVFLLGVLNGIAVVTATCFFLFGIHAASAAYLRHRPKHFFMMGTLTETSEAILAHFADSGAMSGFYRNLGSDPKNVEKLSTIVVTRGGVESRHSVDYLKVALQCGVNIVDEREFYSELFGRAPVFGTIHDCDVIVGLHARLPFSETLMRMFDFVIAAVALILLLPVFAAIALLIRLDSRGPIIFVQTRQGRNNTPFRIFKFRTMYEGPRKATFTRPSDPRVTRIGEFLRHFHFDELPQLFNVLRGEMSLVGPRPEALFFAQAMRQKIPAYDLRYTVRPGITGWAQLSQGYALDSLPATLEKLSYDFYYLKKRNVGLDLAILLRTCFFIWNDNSYNASKKT